MILRLFLVIAQAGKDAVDIQFGHLFIGIRSAQVLVQLLQTGCTGDDAGNLLAA